MYHLPISVRRRAGHAITSAALVLLAACGRSDSTLQSDTQARLAADPAIRDLAVTVTATDGIIRLSGETKSEEQRQRAVELARGVDGVRDVVNELQIAEDPVVGAVRDALAADPMLESVPIEVKADEDVVRLYSTQTSQQHRTRAMEIARKLAGGRHVEDWMK